MNKKKFSGRDKDKKGSRFKGKVFQVEDDGDGATWGGGPTEGELERMKWRSKKQVESSSEEDSSSDEGEDGTEEETGDESGDENDTGSGEDEDSDEEFETQESYNPNRMPQILNKGSQSEMMGGGRLTRREREQLDKEQSQKRAWELYEKGLSELAKRDIARLEEVKIRREADRAARLARVAAQKSMSSISKK